MKLDFSTIELTNFKAFIGGPHNLNLERLGVGLHFVVGQNQVEPRLGSNGSAKSSLICDSLSWCLYGKTTSGLKNPDIRSWNVKGTTTVSVSIRIDDQKHVIQRTTNPNLLTLDGKECAQQHIDGLLQLSFEVFSQTVLLGQGQPLFFDKTSSEKMELLSEVLNLSRWEVWSEKAGKEVAELGRLEASGSGELTGLGVTSAELEKLAGEALKGAEAWSSERNVRLKALKAELTLTRKLHEQEERERSGFDLAYDGACTELQALLPSLEQKQKTLQDYVTRRNKAQIQVSVFQNNIDRLEKELASLGQTDKCPTCGQSVKGTDLDKRKAEIKEAIETDQDDQENFYLEAEELQTLIADINKEIDTIKSQQKEFQRKVDRARVLMDAKANAVAILAAKITSIQSDIKRLDEESNPYRDQVQQLRKRKVAIDVQIEELENTLAYIKKKIEQTKFWVKGFKDIQLLIIEELLQELEMVCSSMLDEIGLKDWIVQFEIEKETKSGSIQRKLNTTILSPNSKSEVKWGNWSGGEAQRLRVVSALALSEVLLSHAGVEVGLEILDEPTQHLSKEGVADLCEYLSNRAKELEKQIFLIDHMARDSSDFKSTVTVVKTKNGSIIQPGPY